jgi:ribosomal protein S18 acetylase RimI-like enzyme
MYVWLNWTTNVLRISALIFIQSPTQSQYHLDKNVGIQLPVPVGISAFNIRSISNPTSIRLHSLTNYKSYINSHYLHHSMIRPPSVHDLPDMKSIIDAAELFPSEMLDEMTKNYFDQQPQMNDDGIMSTHSSNTAVTTNGSNEYWFIKVVTQELEDPQQPQKDVVVALLYAGPEKMTEGCYNVFLLAVHPQYHRLGYGRELMTHVEDHWKNHQIARIVLVETSGNDEYHTARDFYTALGYNAVARIPEFYQEGEDKIIYHKFLR